MWQDITINALRQEVLMLRNGSVRILYIMSVHVVHACAQSILDAHLKGVFDT